MTTRRYTVVVSPGEAARLMAFSNEGRTSWPLGDNRTFRRRGADTFVVKDFASMGMGQAMVVTQGTARLRGEEVRVVVRTRGAWVGWLLVAGGLLCFTVVPRDGLTAAALGLVLAAGGWLLFLRRPGRESDLDQVEAVLRTEIAGEWRPG